MFVIDVNGKSTRSGDLRAMTQETEPRYIRHCIDTESEGNFRSTTIKLHHHLNCGIDVFRQGFASLYGGCDQASTERFRQNEAIARARAVILLNISPVDNTRYGVAEFNLVVTDRVTAKQGDAGLTQLI